MTFFDWSLVQGLGTIDTRIKDDVEKVLAETGSIMEKGVKVKSDWYYGA